METFLKLVEFELENILIMTVFQLLQLLNQSVSAGHSNEFGVYHELFVTIAKDGYLVVGFSRPVKWKNLSAELLQDFLEFLSLYQSGVEDYEMVCENVFRVWLRKGSQTIKPTLLSKAS